jgi:DNA topoisomerase-3
MGRPFAAIIKLSEIPIDDKDYPNAGYKLEFDFGQNDVDNDEPVDFTGLQALGACPKCSGAVYEHGMNYICERSVGPDRSCDFSTGKVILQQEVSSEQVQKLLSSGKTDLLTNFKSQRNGRVFKAYLAFDVEKGKVGFEFEVRAPKVPAKKRDGDTEVDSSTSKAVKSVPAKLPVKKPAAKKSTPAKKLAK